VIPWLIVFITGFVTGVVFTLVIQVVG